MSSLNRNDQGITWSMLGVSLIILSPQIKHLLSGFSVLRYSLNFEKLFRLISFKSNILTLLAIRGLELKFSSIYVHLKLIDSNNMSEYSCKIP